ncbi:MAG: hypothetical protein ACYTEW_12090 [Planctomycetota bacterium]|jgi:hypothetical protein
MENYLTQITNYLLTQSWRKLLNANHKLSADAKLADSGLDHRHSSSIVGAEKQKCTRSLPAVADCCG